MQKFFKAILTTTTFALALGIGVASLSLTSAHAAYDPCKDYPEYCMEMHNS
jgi:hypothetical protein